MTTGVWTRGVLQNEYGVDPSKVTWVIDDEEHVTELNLPDNVIHLPAGKSLAVVSCMAYSFRLAFRLLPHGSGGSCRARG